MNCVIIDSKRASDDDLRDFLSIDELQRELTEVLLAVMPSFTSEQILQARKQSLPWHTTIIE